MKRTITILLSLIITGLVYAQKSEWYINELYTETIPYIAGEEGEYTYYGIHGCEIEGKIYNSFDLSQSETGMECTFEAYAKWNISNSFQLVALNYGNYSKGIEYLVCLNSNGEVIDKLLTAVCNYGYEISPMSYKIQADKSIVVRQAVISSIIDKTPMCGGFTPKEFYMQYVDKTYTISSEGKFVLKNTTEHAIEKKTWKDFEGLNIIMDE